MSGRRMSGMRFSLGNEGKDGKNLNSQTWPGSPRRPSPRHLRPPDSEFFGCQKKGGMKGEVKRGERGRRGDRA